MQKTSTAAANEGVFAALITPRRPNTIEIDTAALLDYMDKVAAAGVDGIVFLGSTGEFVHFDLEERMRATALAAKRSRLPFFVNASHSTLSGVRDLAEHAAENGAAGVLITPPYFYQYSDPEIETFYGKVGETFEGEIDLYLYNLPRFAPALSREVLTSVLSSGRFAGIKDSSGDWDTFEFLLRLRERRPFQLFDGHEEIYARCLQAGCDSLVSGIAAAVPELPVAMRRAANAGKMDTVNALAMSVSEFLGWVRQFPTPIAVKEAAELRGWVRSTAASPLSRSSEDRLSNFRDWFSAWLPKVLDACAAADA